MYLHQYGPVGIYFTLCVKTQQHRFSVRARCVPVVASGSSFGLALVSL